MPEPVRQRQEPPRDVIRSDRRWFLAAATGFVLSFGGLFGMHGLYRATGPHPAVTIFLRAVKRQIRRVIPRIRRH